VAVHFPYSLHQDLSPSISRDSSVPRSISERSRIHHQVDQQKGTRLRWAATRREKEKEKAREREREKEREREREKARESEGHCFKRGYLSGSFAQDRQG
jgi:hypothetical protein